VVEIKIEPNEGCVSLRLRSAPGEWEVRAPPTGFVSACGQVVRIDVTAVPLTPHLLQMLRG
jgi:hypothetical protein